MAGGFLSQGLEQRLASAIKRRPFACEAKADCRSSLLTNVGCRQLHKHTRTISTMRCSPGTSLRRWRALSWAFKGSPDRTLGRFPGETNLTECHDPVYSPSTKRLRSRAQWMAISRTRPFCANDTLFLHAIRTHPGVPTRGYDLQNWQ
jgi:hypothetical protein